MCNIAHEYHHCINYRCREKMIFLKNKIYCDPKELFCDAFSDTVSPKNDAVKPKSDKPGTVNRQFWRCKVYSSMNKTFAVYFTLRPEFVRFIF